MRLANAPARHPLTASLRPRLILLLTLPPLLWAGNAVLGRSLIDVVPPLLLNALRWLLALALLLPFAERRWREGSLIGPHWRWWLASGVLGMSAYNSLQYQALHSSTALNVTLIAASLPLAMLLVGLIGWRQVPRRRQWAGAALSLAGVLVVISHGRLDHLLAVRFVAGDALMLVATLSWAGYSWLLARRPAGLADWPWTDLLAVQIVFALPLCLAAAAAEQSWTAVALQPDGALLAALLFIALGPSLLAYRCWSQGVAEGGPALAGFFVNLTPLFAALMSMAWLGEPPQPFHGLAFALIAAGIAVSSKA